MLEHKLLAQQGVQAGKGVAHQRQRLRGHRGREGGGMRGTWATTVGDAEPSTTAGINRLPQRGAWAMPPAAGQAR